MVAHICAVILTHSRAPLVSSLSVPFLVTTDNARAANLGLWGAKYIDVGVFKGTERAIGAHMYGAIQLAFDTFENCEAVAVLEDDVTVSDDYFSAVDAAVTAGADCFTCINDRGAVHDNWDPQYLRPVTYSIGIGMAITRRVFFRLQWGVGFWDNFLRTTSDLVCLSPELSRCRHHARQDSTHGVNGVSKALDLLPFASGQSIFLIRDPPALALQNCVAHQKLKPHRGTYFGITETGCRQFQPPLASNLAYVWTLGHTAQSCTERCQELALSCSPRGLTEPASVHVAAYKGLRGSPCTHYGSETGRELPSAITIAPAVTVCNVPWFDQPLSCSARHHLTQRLCPCFSPSKHNILYYA